MANFKLRRRHLLQSAAATAFLWPVIRATMAKAAPTPAKRLVVLFTPNGLNFPDAAASGTGPNFNMGDYYTPLEKHRADLIALTKMHIGGVPFGENSEVGHRSGGMGCLTCTPDEKTGKATGPSIDQFVARKLFEQKIVSYIRAPVFTVSTSGVSEYAHSFFEAAGVPVPLVNDPVAAFESLFHDVIAQMGPDKALLLAQKKSILDASWEDCKSYSSELPSEGKALLDYHCERIRELEKNLESVYAGACAPPQDELTTVTGLDVNDPNNYNALTDFFWRLIEVALSCDVTRVASFSFGTTATRFNMPWVNPPLLASVDTGDMNVRDHHSHTHAGTRETVGLFMNWYSTKIAELMDRLKTVRPDSTRLFDSTITHWTTEYGGAGHSNADVPMFLFGNANGQFSTGRHIELDNKAEHSHALMVSIIQAMGITGVNQFGHPAGGSGPLSELA